MIRVNASRLDAQLRELIRRMDAGQLQGILATHATPMVESSRRLLRPRRRTGLLEDSMILSRGTRGISAVAQVAIGVKRVTGRRRGRRVRPGKYAHLIELGFRSRRARRAITGLFFQRRAYDLHRERIIQGVIHDLRGML